MPPGRPSSSLHFAVGELSGKVDQILTTILPQLEAERKLREAGDAGLDARVTDLEVWRWRAAGGGGVILFLVGSWEVWQHVIRR